MAHQLSAPAKRAVSQAKAGHGRKLTPAVKQELRGQPSAPAASPSGSGWQLPQLSMPDLSLPGGSAGEKVLWVGFILLIGMALYSRVTGQPMVLALRGLTTQRASGAGMAAGTPQAQGSSYYAQQNRRLAVASDTMATRMSVANPARIA